MQNSQEIKEFLIGRSAEITNQKRCSDHQWEHCFKFFSKGPHDVELACLHLAFYLASWGMYRGSAGIRDFDHLIHRPAVTELLLPKYDTLRSASLAVIGSRLDDLLWPLAEKIRSCLYPSRVNVTDTLLTKILMGTLGCTPAYDRNFKAGVREDQLNQVFSRKGFRSLIEHCQQHSEGFLEAQNKIPGYPIMRLVDMYYYACGRDEFQ